MSASQLLTDYSSQSTHRSFQQFELPAFPASQVAVRLHAFTALAILHARFSANEVFYFGCDFAATDGEHAAGLRLIEVVVDPDSSIQDILQFAKNAMQTEASVSASECGVAIVAGSTEFAPAVAEKFPALEVAYQLDLESGRLTIHYRDDLFDIRTVQNWGSFFTALMLRLSDNENLDQTVGSIDLANEQIRSRVLELGDATGDATSHFFDHQPNEQFTFHRQFEAQVERTPDQIAVWAKNDPADETGIAWSYRELNRQANLVASRLIEMGVQVEDTVGIVMDRRVCLLATAIGIMKAGGRYVGLEPELPTDRLAFMTNDANVRYIVTESNHVHRSESIAVAAGRSIEILDWDGDDFQRHCENQINNGAHDQNPDTGVNSRNGAYLIYTSGSTGNPKGVDVWHHSFVDLCYTFAAMLELGPDDTGLAITTIAFDASIAEIYPLLLLGGKVGLGHKRVGANGAELSALIEQVDATYMCATPTSLRILVASGWTSSPKLTVVAGGEAVSELVCREVGPKVRRIVNGYGPTEATVYTTLGQLSTDQKEPIPIGLPVLNSRCYVVDDHGQLLPPMVRGNLFIGGQSPARGYLNRPELNAEKFVDDPFVDRSSLPQGTPAKMYDSGDVVYWSHDGIIHYIGRSDHQVKLRGYRIELGEIEARLNAHPAVADAVAMVREDTPGQQRLVAYVIYKQRVADQVLQEHLLADMPDYMVPTWFVPLASFPTNANLKLDRKALPNPDDVEVEIDQPDLDGDADADHLADQIAGIWTSILNRKIRVDDQVFRMGADSLTAVKFQAKFSDELNRTISVGEVFQFSTPRLLAKQLSASATGSTAGKKSLQAGPIRDIAIVGLAGRFPGAANVDEFWENLVNGVESVLDFSNEDLEAAGVPSSVFSQENYQARGTRLDDAYDFEPEFFGITRADAKTMSPQIRLFMKTAYEALEHAGYPEQPKDHRIGVFAGGGQPNYLIPGRHIPELERLQRLIGNGADFMATRTSYALGLTGPAIGVQTACSTSLVAVVNAVEAIRRGQCEMALAGGSSYSWPADQGYQHGEGLIYSSDGHCRAFDHRASGTLFSQAAGAVLLRPLEDAIAAGDTIHAVIKGVGLNNDGNRKGGFSSPSIEGQAEVVRMAIDDADIDVDDITLLEAHGTGTKIGDPIEVAAITRAWRMDTQRTGYCSIGSVKTNIGHADAAAGISGLIKLVMSLKHQQIAPLINFEKPNPEIDFASTPFVVDTKRKPWVTDTGTRYAAVTALGMGGTNAHVILSEGQPAATTADANNDESDTASGEFYMVPFSARTPESLTQSLQHWQNASTAFSHRLADVAHTLQSGRKHFKQRACAVVDSNRQLANALEFEDKSTPTSSTSLLVRGTGKAVGRKAVFLFTGQGAQYSGMAKELYQSEPVFKQALERCDSILKNNEMELLSWLYADDPPCDINQTQFAQLALFSVSYAQTELWKSWGIQPAAMIGHSIGEYAAATAAGVMSLKDALKVVANRGRLMQSMPTGTMLAVMHGDKPIAEILNGVENIDLAVVNSRSVAVVAGPDAAIEELVQRLDHSDIKSKKLHTSHAFHSHMMEPMLAEFVELVQSVNLQPPQIPYLSNVSGDWITKAQAVSPEYYADQIRSTVKFAENLETLLSDDDEFLFLELGPGSTLTQLAKSQFAGRNHVAISTIPGPRDSHADSRRVTWRSLAQAWCAGLELDWANVNPKVNGSRPKKVPLPTYRFNEQSYRVDPEPIGKSAAVTDAGNGSWFNVPTWKQNLLSDHQIEENCFGDGIWLLLTRTGGISRERIADQLHFNNVENANDSRPTIISVFPGRCFQSNEDGSFTIDPSQEEDYQRLVREASDRGEIKGIIHAWSFNAQGRCPSHSGKTPADFWRRQQESTIGISWLAKALGTKLYESEIPLTVLTCGIADIDPAVTTNPTNHSLVGALSVIQKEFRAIATKVIDIGSDVDQFFASNDIERLFKSCLHEPLLVFDRSKWWSMSFDQVQLQAPQQPPLIENGARIVITGGLGALARNMAIELSHRYKGLKFALLVRKELPPRSDWDRRLASQDQESAELRQRLRDVLDLQQRSDVEIFVCDVADPAQLESAFSTVQEKFGKIDGVLHTAGVLRDGIIATKTMEQMESVFGAKAIAAETCINHVLPRFTEIKFAVLFSSIASDLGLFGQFDYSAANNFLDGLSQSMQRSSTQVYSINWPAFRDVGMAARSQAGLSTDTDLAREISENSFSVREGTEALIQIVNQRQFKRVTLSKRPFHIRHAEAVADGRSVKIGLDLNTELDASETGNDPESIEDKMLTVWRQQFDNPGITLDDDYFDLGGDSLMAVSMIAQIERVFGKLLPISHLVNSPTPQKLIKKMGLEATPTSPDSVEQNAPGSIGNAAGSVLSPDGEVDGIVCLRESSDSTQPPLFLVHGADGAVMFYRDFARRLRTDRAIYAIESPLLSTTGYEIPDSVEQLAVQYIKMVQQVQPHGPYWFGGYSFGGVVAYEMARRLQQADEEIESLVLYDVGNPAETSLNSTVFRIKKFWKENQSASTLKRIVKLGKRASQSVRDRATFELENRVAKFKIVDKVEDQQSQVFWRHKKARERHMAMEDAFVPKPFDGTVRVVAATGNSSKIRVDELMGWGDVARNVKVAEVPGSHLELFDDPFVAHLLETTEAILAEIVRKPVVISDLGIPSSTESKIDSKSPTNNGSHTQLSNDNNFSLQTR